MNKIIKTSIIIFIIIFFSYLKLFGQIDSANQLLQSYNDEIVNINNQSLKKIYLKPKILGSFTPHLSEEDWSNGSDAIYFDFKERVRKSVHKYEYPESEGMVIHYYNEDGSIFYSLFSSFSPMSNGYSIQQYLLNNGELLYLDYIKRDDDRNGDIIENSIIRGGYGLKTPKIETSFFDGAIHKDSLANFIQAMYQVDSLYCPNNAVSIKNISPKKDDLIFVNRNSVNLRKDASTTYNHIHKLNVGDEVTILDIEGNWYKVEFHNRYGDNKIGYVLGDYLEPVEKEVK